MDCILENNEQRNNWDLVFHFHISILVIYSVLKLFTGFISDVFIE